MNLIESLLPLILPLLASYADENLPTGPKRLLYVLMVCLDEEALAKLQQTATTLDEKAFEALLLEAREEFAEAGLPDVPAQLGQFVQL